MLDKHILLQIADILIDFYFLFFIFKILYIVRMLVDS
jgi:hypothetical protein